MFPLRDENPSHSFPFFTILFILANTLIFVYQASLGPAAEAFVLKMGMIPLELTERTNLPYSMGVPPALTLLTSMFLHGGIGHLLGNMWFLWIFGDNIEHFLGHVRFVLFYLATGIAAGLTHYFMNPESTIPTIGASGAISGILGAYVVLFPKIRVKTLVVLGFYITVARVPAIFFLGIWFLMQALGGMGSGDSGVAFAAHVGGFIAGALGILLLTRSNPYPETFRFEPHRRRR